MFATKNLILKNVAATPLKSLLVRGYKKTVEQLAKEKPGLLKDARVLVRVDFNVPLSKADGTTITDDTRIREALPTINFLTAAGAKVMLASHCGRPKGAVNEKMRMAPMAKRLSELIKKPVITTTDCIGPEVDAAVAKMVAGDVLLLENARFYKEEEKNNADFAKKLAKNATIFVNDAFGTAHRAHASTEGVCHYVEHKVRVVRWCGAVGCAVRCGCGCGCGARSSLWSHVSPPSDHLSRPFRECRWRASFWRRRSAS
jgi:hypothetical protein